MSDAGATPPSFWRAVGATFSGTARHVRTCLALVSVYALLNGASTAISRTVRLGTDPTAASASELFAIGAASLAGIGTLLLVAVFVYPPTIGALSLVGSAAVAADSLETHGIVTRVFDRALEVIGAFVLTLLVVLVAPIAAGLIALVVYPFAGAEGAFAALLFVGLVLLVPMTYVFVRLSLAIPVVLREGLGPVGALRRSWQLVGGVWWWVAAVLVVVGISGTILGAIVSSIVSLGNAGAFSIFDPGPSSSNFVLAAIGDAAGAAISGALFGVGTGVVYEARAEARPPAELPLPDAPEPEVAPE